MKSIVKYFCEFKKKYLIFLNLFFKELKKIKKYFNVSLNHEKLKIDKKLIY